MGHVYNTKLTSFSNAKWDTCIIQSWHHFHMSHTIIKRLPFAENSEHLKAFIRNYYSPFQSHSSDAKGKYYIFTLHPNMKKRGGAKIGAQQYDTSMYSSLILANTNLTNALILSSMFVYGKYLNFAREVEAKGVLYFLARMNVTLVIALF